MTTDDHQEAKAGDIVIYAAIHEGLNSINGG